MADETDLADVDSIAPRTGRVRRWALAGAGVVALVLGGVWGMRERIAADVIDRELASLGLPAHYRIESIGLGREVLGAVVVGDPSHPDLTIARVEIVLRYGLGRPAIERIVLVQPRLYGQLRDGRVHFGALDRLIYAPSSGAPVRLPDWALVLTDARGRIDSGWGTLAFSADGEGRLSDGFAGTLGVVVPQARFGQCDAARTTVFGHITTQAGRPHFVGPLRASGLRCGDLHVGQGQADLTLAGDNALENWSIGGRLSLGRIASGTQTTLSALDGEAGLRWQVGKGQLAGRVTLDVKGLAASAVPIADARLDGSIHARQGSSAFDFRGDISGTGLTRGPMVRKAMDNARTNARGTPLGPLIDRVAQVLARQETSSRLAGSLGIHVDPAGWRLAIPALRMRGGQNGQTVARLDQVVVSGGDSPGARLVGKFATGGSDLPVITGAMAADGQNATQIQLAMAPYSADGAMLSVPNLTVSQRGTRAFGLAGRFALSGPVGQGRIDRLVMPVDGEVSTDGQLALLRHCATPNIERLRAGTLDLVRTSLTLCPVGGWVVRADASGTHVAATLPGLVLRGKAGDSPIVLRAGAGRIVWPGASKFGNMDVAWGKGRELDHVHLDDATVSSSGKLLGGTFGGGNVAMAALPAKLGAAAGTWRLDGDRLSLTGGAFTLSDQAAPVRFFPVNARNANVTMVDGKITGSARLESARAGEELAQVTLRHDLTSGQGVADLAIAGIRFRDADAKTRKAGFQPVDLSDLAKGIIANANGTIKGAAQFSWNVNAPDGGLTGTGRFSSLRTG
jgi:hypothetical protein